MKRSHSHYLSLIIISVVFLIMPTGKSYSQQINIPRIDKMPDLPAPYLMRDWKNVSMGYDSLVFNKNLSGTYLPLIWTDNNSINYPGSSRFGLHTVVGTTVPQSAEAINCLPAVIGATLSGIDKSNQNGDDWVAMCKEWFNKNNGLDVYKNGFSDNTSDDFWYETMPNIFFYQLNYLYPGNNIFKSQFTSVADQWLEVVNKMGGSTIPWHIPNMKYQGWDFSTMTAFPNHVHDEPEVAGAVAWMLYNAYTETGNSKYRIGAEQAMEYLNSLNSNPAYELQLSYGVYIAARMNAELGTNYDITKMLNWCFNTDNIRNWGAMVGNWGGYDVDGLIGEVNGNNDYPFVMNTFEQIGALVPMVRYDERYARAIGKWVLNAANAARLFYPKYLPSQNQDQPSKQWADQYDSASYIAHEAMHQHDPNNYNITPYASGDPIGGGWGKTNLALYGSSHVGILGGIIDTTNVKGILKLDLLKTDYFHQPAYPTFLFYNPYSSDQTVVFNAGSELRDIYDLVSKQFIANSVSGQVNLTIPANGVVIAVLTPQGGTQTYQKDKFLVNGVVVDFHSGKFSGNYPPRIKSLNSTKQTLIFNDTTSIFCTATDLENDTLTYSWKASAGKILGEGSAVKYVSSDTAGNIIVTCTVSDSKNSPISESDSLTVINKINHVPVISNLIINTRKIDIGKSTSAICIATDQDNDSLNYNWFSSAGTIIGAGSSVTWQAPSAEGNYYIKCAVNDSLGAYTSDSVWVEVRDLSIQQTGNLVASFPFDGNATDISGNGNNGTLNNVFAVNDRFGNPNGALSFNGVNSYVLVPNSQSLNFTKSITINYWMKVNNFLSREQYVISHGSYDNRWKVSIIPENKLRWTIKTTNGITDLDSEVPLVRDSLYNITTAYNGSDVEIYINGKLNSFKKWSGDFNTANIALTIGQMLPNDNNYNFDGVLDDIKIYDYALSLDQIKELYQSPNSVDDQTANIPQTENLVQNYPNPFNPATNIKFDLNKESHINLTIYNSLGQKIETLIDKTMSAGSFNVVWNANGFASGIYFYVLKTDNNIYYKKMILMK